MYENSDFDPKIRGKMFYNRSGDNILFFYRKPNDNNNSNSKHLYMLIDTKNDTYLKNHYLSIWKVIKQTTILATEAQKKEWTDSYKKQKKKWTY